jgi:AraC-like DNA-binding protein
MDYRVKKVIALMKEYLHRGWPASRLAQFVNISPSRLHQLFKDETGLPPAKYLHSLRMQQAKELLETSYLSVKEVMTKVGVTDESHFVRDFRKAYGFTPAKYRERFLNGHFDTEAEHRRLSSVTGRSFSSSTLRQAAPPAPPSGTAPLLLRRASHPRHLTEDSSPLMRTRTKRELLSLIHLRHVAFSKLTTTITDNIARNLPNIRSILYRPRRSTTSRRLPPAARRREFRPLHPLSSVTAPPLPSTARRKD